METRDNVNIIDFDQCTAALGIEFTPLLSSSLQVNIKFPSSTIKVMSAY